MGEEVVALVIDDDKGREVLDLDLPNSFHAQFRVFQDLDLADAVLGQPRRRPADYQEMEKPSCTAVARSILCRSSRDTCPIFLSKPLFAGGRQLIGHCLIEAARYSNRCLAGIQLADLGGQGHDLNAIQVFIGQIVAQNDGGTALANFSSTAGSKLTHHTSPRFIRTVSYGRFGPLKGLGFPAFIAAHLGISRL